MNDIDFEECLKDSPAYRTQLRQATNHIDMLEDRLEQMAKSCNTVIAHGKSFVLEFQKFLKSIYDVREVFPSDDITFKSLTKFGDYLNEIQALFYSLFEQTTNSVLRTLTRMLKEDIKKVKDQGKLFERLSSDYDNALQRNADASKTKPHVCDDASKILLATRSCFGHTSIDYTYQINVLFNQQKIELVELLLSYINIHKAFFHQGHELLSFDTERDFNTITSQLTKMRQENVQKQKKLEKVHDANQRKPPPSSLPTKLNSTSSSTNSLKSSTLLSSHSMSMKSRLSLLLRNHNREQCNLDDVRNVEANSENLSPMTNENLPRNPSQQSLSNLPTTPAAVGIELIKEGYLFKRSHNKFRTWSRRWFSIRNGQLLYMKRNNANSSNDNSQQQLPYSVMVPDLRLCTIRLANDNDRRFVFEILSPNSSHLLQADSQLQCDQWVNSLQLAIKNSFKSCHDNGQNSNSSSPRSNDEHVANAAATEKIEFKQKIIRDKIEYVRSLSGNEKCCDCNADGPEWASINLGILLCLNCGGAHRGLGVNLSKVRSLHMDSWDLETLLVMSELGNALVNDIYEAQIPNGIQKPNADTDAVTRRAFIETKYVQKAFVRQLPSADNSRFIKRWPAVKISITNNGDNDDDIVKKPTISDPQVSSNTVTTDQDAPNQENLPSVWNANTYLYEAARQHNLIAMLHALALGADKNFINENDHGRTPLIQAILSKSVAAAELLLTNNAKVHLTDQDGKTPLHYATQLTHKGRGPIILLIKRGANPLLKDKHGVDACSLSMEVGDPDVITWFRLVALHEQMKEEDEDVEKAYISILDDSVYIKEIARTPSFS